MLTHIQIDNFKSYRHAVLPLAPLTVLIGANASGKSNAIEALRLLCWVGRGGRMSFVDETPFGRDNGIRGQIPALGFQGKQFFTLSATTSLAAWNRFSITLGVRDGELHVKEERIESTDTESFLYHAIAKKKNVKKSLFEMHGDLTVKYKDGKTNVECRDDFPVLQQVRSIGPNKTRNGKSENAMRETCDRHEASLSSMFFLDPNPSMMRDYGHKTDHRLSGDGQNLSGVLYNLQQSAGNPDILELARSLPEQNITGLSFIMTQRDEVMLLLEETFGGHKRTFDAAVLSDGTLRVLSIAAAILSAPTGSLVVVEEADNGIHPSRAESILKIISRIAHERDLRVLITTHNPALLDALPDEAMSDVVFCYRDPKDGSSRLTRLGDLSDYPELVAQDTLGHLLTRGVIDRFIKYRPAPQEKAKKAREWLRRLNDATA